MAGKVRRPTHPYEMQGSLVATEQLLDWQAQMLRSMAKADAASEAYERRKPEIKKHHVDRLIKLNGVAEDYALRKAMDSSWTLNDLIAEHAWHRDEANRFNNAIMAQWALRQMLSDTTTSSGPKLAKILLEATRDAV